LNADIFTRARKAEADPVS